ncbi:hypothetical protein [Fulvivirga lutimaris]|uniref:hypothetical protein n=1 Tax=Fulvivirga lutimaris TaxID=1819566 RepID=UPI0012BBB158|nr:hypothetical protein [Fulvivirga lutimaris]MTI37952.1 hypothetical protein [Fulvivirga lutimaris]
MKFLDYLLTNRNYSDAIFLLKKIQPNNQLQSDSINFLLGKTHYLDQQLEQASNYFDKLNKTTLPLRSQAFFFNAFCAANTEKLSKSLRLLNNIETTDSLQLGLRNLEMAGISLLSRDLDAFDQYATNFMYGYYHYSEQEKSFIGIRNDLKFRKKKSPLLAGIMSTIVPGSGKIYAGKVGIGIGTMLTTTILGLQTWEGYKKDGAESARFIIFGSLFSMFYISNIWGSVFTVKFANKEFDEAVNYKILVDMHIPLRTIFN